MKNYDFEIRTINNYGTYNKFFKFNKDAVIDPYLSSDDYTTTFEIVWDGYYWISARYRVIFNKTEDPIIYLDTVVNKDKDGNLPSYQDRLDILIGAKEIDGDWYLFAMTRYNSGRIRFTAVGNSLGQFVYPKDDIDFLPNSTGMIKPTLNYGNTNMFTGSNGMVKNSIVEDGNIKNFFSDIYTVKTLLDANYVKIKFQYSSYGFSSILVLYTEKGKITLFLSKGGNNSVFKSNVIYEFGQLSNAIEIKQIQNDNKDFVCIYISPTDGIKNGFLEVYKSGVGNYEIDVEKLTATDTDYTSGTDVFVDSISPYYDDNNRPTGLLSTALIFNRVTNSNKTKPIWYAKQNSGTHKWVEADGEIAGIRRVGEFSQRPTSDLTKGFSYFATDKGSAGVGAMIYYTGNSTTPWVYADGTAVS